MSSSKNILIFCDGTGNQYGPNNTNVVHLFEAVTRDERQLAFYDPGVGTFSFLGIPLAKRIGTALGKAFGRGLRHNIAEAYTFLMNHYGPGDRIFLFGFSRGAFTVRALAGMLRRCGLLRQGYQNLLPYALENYVGGALETGSQERYGIDPTQVENDQETSGEDWERGFRGAFSHEVSPYFIGVWDTVKSLGAVRDKKFKDSELDPGVRYAYHAVSIDEQRQKFPVSLWDEPKTRVDSRQVLEQVWFPGVHSDVGGWYEERDLSDISLQWMLEKAVAAGVRLRDGWQQAEELHPYSCGVLHESWISYWRLWTPLQREIPPGAKIHRSVLERREGCYDYDPPLPDKYEVVEPGEPFPCGTAGTDAVDLAPIESPSGIRGPLDLAPYRHLLDRGTTGIEIGARRVWQQVRDLPRRPLGRRAEETQPGDRPGSFLEAVPPATIRQLASQGIIIDVPAGTLVTRKGCNEREMFVVLEGEFEADDDGQCLGRIAKGEVFGEMAFFHSDGCRTASVQACRESRVLVLRRKSVEKLLHDDPTVATLLLRRLGGIMADRLAGQPSGPPALS